MVLLIEIMYLWCYICLQGGATLRFMNLMEHLLVHVLVVKSLLSLCMFSINFSLEEIFHDIKVSFLMCFCCFDRLNSLKKTYYGHQPKDCQRYSTEGSTELRKIENFLNERSIS